MNCSTSSCVPRFLAVAAIAMLVVALFTMPAHAQILCTTMSAPGCTLSFVGGVLDNPSAGEINPTAWVPLVSGGVLELTQNAPNERGAAWFNTPQQVEGGFGVEFQFQITTTVGSVGDGLAFVIQNSSSTPSVALAAIGGFGGGIGYGTREFDPCSGVTTAATYSVPPCAAGTDLGIPNSVAIEFDTFANSYDLDPDHVAIQSCGTVNNLPDHSSPCLIARTGANFLDSLVNPIVLSDGLMHYVQIVYLPYSATCPTANPCPNLSVYIDPALNGGAPVLQAHVDLNNPCAAAAVPSGCGSGPILSGNTAAYVGFTAATRGAQSEHLIQSFTFTPSVTRPLQGSGVTNSFVFPFATYNVTYPADVPVTNTTMTITPTVLPPADCNKRINIFGEGNVPTCTTFPSAGSDAVIFDVACAVAANQTQGDTTPPGLACPTTTGFNPLQPTSTFHSNEDISNIVNINNGTIPAGVAPQFLTATEGTNAWVPIGVGFSTDLTKGGGTNNYQSQMVLADFPLVGGTSPFLVQYQFNGFTSPVNQPAINSAQAGQTIPFKWQLLYPSNAALGFNGGPVTNLSLVVPPAAPTTFPFLTLDIVGECTNTSSSSDTSVPVDTESQNGLVNQGNGFYQYNWQTPKTLANQCVIVDAEVGDGQPHEANIQFHK